MDPGGWSAVSAPRFAVSTNIKRVWDIDYYLIILCYFGEFTDDILYSFVVVLDTKPSN